MAYRKFNLVAELSKVLRGAKTKADRESLLYLAAASILKQS